MPISQGLKTSLNKMREISSDVYHKYIPVIDDSTDIGAFGTPILEMPAIQNEFISRLLQRIVYTSFETKYFNNPLQMLEGDSIPLGYAGQDIYVNPAKARQYNVEDFAGILFKYESDVKVQYHTVNSDLQYIVTVSRQKLKQAFVSWGALATFIDNLASSLYNGAYIDDYRFTKQLVSGAFKGNNVCYRKLAGDPKSSDQMAKDFVKQARTDYLNFKVPSTNFNAWKKIGGVGKPITTWTDPEDVVILIRNDVRASLDVDVLANAFNIDKTTLLGRMLEVDNFDVFDDEGVKVYDGSHIVAMLADKSWFKIKPQDMFMDTFYNPNNRTTQYILNVIKMREFSYFANAVVYCTKEPVVEATAIKFTKAAETIKVGEKKIIEVETTPANATADVTFESGTKENVSIEKIDNRHARITGVMDGASNITATIGGHNDTMTATAVSE